MILFSIPGSGGERHEANTVQNDSQSDTYMLKVLGTLLVYVIETSSVWP